MEDDIKLLCGGKPYTLIIRNSDTLFSDEVMWLKENLGKPISYPNDGNVWGGIVDSSTTTSLNSTPIYYFFLNNDDAILFKLAMV